MFFFLAFFFRCLFLLPGPKWQKPQTARDIATNILSKGGLRRSAPAAMWNQPRIPAQDLLPRCAVLRKIISPLLHREVPAPLPLIRVLHLAGRVVTVPGAMMMRAILSTVRPAPVRLHLAEAEDQVQLVRQAVVWVLAFAKIAPLLASTVFGRRASARPRLSAASPLLLPQTRPILPRTRAAAVAPLDIRDGAPFVFRLTRVFPIFRLPPFSCAS